MCSLNDPMPKTHDDESAVAFVKRDVFAMISCHAKARTCSISDAARSFASIATPSKPSRAFVRPTETDPMAMTAQTRLERIRSLMPV